MEVEVVVKGRYNDATGRAGNYDVGDKLVTKLWYGESLINSGFCRTRSIRRQVIEQVSEVLSVATGGRVLPVGPARRSQERIPGRHEPAIRAEVPGRYEPTNPTNAPIVSLPPMVQGGWEDEEVTPVRVIASASARKLAEAEGIKLTEVVGTSPEGKIGVEDVRRHLDK
jgi:pyruvate/2-oxoglutarate dehydrogenase complex dihydrolipoamide acyltransferase (E2) component